MRRAASASWSGLIPALLAVAGTGASAHEIRPALLEIEEGNEATLVTWRAPVRGDYTLALTPHLSAGWLESPPQQQTVTPRTLTRSWRIAAPHAPLAGQSLRIDGLERTLTDTFVRVHWRSGEQTALLLKPLHNEMVLTPPTGSGAAIREYFRLGLAHIWGGYDHLLYLAALMLLVTGAGALLGVITAFTAAHSLTLALSVLGVVRLPPAPVEAAIALSILFVAVELRRRQLGEPGLAARWPWLMAFLFGLLHGFGFAGALRETGLPEGAIALPLVLFNLGIEAGQVIFVAAVAALWWLARRHAPLPRAAVARALPSVIGALAAWWLIARLGALVGH